MLRVAVGVVDGAQDFMGKSNKTHFKVSDCCYTSPLLSTTVLSLFKLDRWWRS